MVKQHFGRAIGGWGWAIGLVLATLGADGVLAQSRIEPDETLGEERSRVTSYDDVGVPIDLIEGGARRGGNLFHSFREFNVDRGRSAYFLNPSNEIQNILARVTGANRSEILGTLGIFNDTGVTSTPNLFLINPNGILFGPEASLDVGGSFVATTANAIGFGEFGLFGATNPEVPSSLLTIDPSVFLFNPLNGTGSILNTSTASAGTQPSGAPEFGLRVPDGQSLLLVGGDIVLDGGRLNALGGRIELGGLAGAGSIGLSQVDTGLSLSFPTNSSLASVTLANDGRVSIRGNGGGDIVVTADRFTGTDGGRLVAGTEGSNSGGNITVRANEIRFSGLGAISGAASGILNQAFDTASAGTGDIVIQTDLLDLSNGAEIRNDVFTDSTNLPGSITIQSGTVNLNNSSIIQTGPGEEIGILVNTQNLTLQENSYIAIDNPYGQSNTNSIAIQSDNGIILSRSGIEHVGASEAIGISINTQNLALQEGSYISTENPYEQGSTGDITIQATGVITLDTSNITQTGISDTVGIAINTQSLIQEESSISTQNLYSQGNTGDLVIQAANAITLANSFLGSASTASSQPIAPTTAGDLFIQTGNLTAHNAEIASLNDNLFGNSGNITIRATGDVLLTSDRDANPITRLYATADGGSTGDITLEAANLTLRGASFSTLATEQLSPGDSGNIHIRVTDHVTIDGESETSRSFISTGSNALIENGQGSSGDIQLDAESLQILNGGFIKATSSGSGEGGNIVITADTIELSGAISNADLGSVVTAQAFNTGAAGNLIIRTDRLTLSDNALISTETSNAGQAGSIDITAQDLIALFDDSAIRSSTLGAGDAGPISLVSDTIQLIGTPDSNQRTFAVTSFTSAEGDAGDITISTNQFNLDHGASVSADTFSAGDGGNLTLTTNRLSLGNGSALLARTFSSGAGGTMMITAREAIDLAGTTALSEDISAISTETEEAATNAAGDIMIVTGSLTIRDGAAILSRTFGQQSDAGDITITATDRVTLSGQAASGQAANNPFGSAIRSSVESGAIGQGGRIEINAQSLVMRDGAIIAAEGFGQGPAGDIRINARDFISMQGTALGERGSTIRTRLGSQAIGRGGDIRATTGSLFISNSSGFSANTQGRGNAGNIWIDVRDRLTLTAPESGLLSSIENIVETGAVGNAGDIRIRTGSLILEGSRLFSSTFGQGNAGNITVQAADRISLTENALISNRVGIGAVGNSQQIILQTPTLTLDRSEISASTAGTGEAGQIFVQNADTISLDNSAISTAIEAGAIVPSNESGTTARGTIDLQTRSLSLTNNAQITASTSGQGNAGDIAVRDAETVSLEGQSSISTAVNQNAIGQGGNINLQTNLLELTDRSQITSSTAGQGDTGTLSIQATDRLSLNNSQITSRVEAGAIGNSQQITLQTPTLTLSENSEISASTAGTGQAGRIVVPNADRIALDNSSISTAVEEGAIVPSTSNSRTASPSDSPNDSRGTIDLTTRSLSLRNSQINATTAGDGDAGEIRVRGAETITLSDRSAISTAVTEGDRQGGTITLNTRDLNLSDRSSISAESVGRGDAGNITVRGTGDVTLNDSDITTRAANASGGAIAINTGMIQLFGDSDIQTRVSNGRGGGGDIVLTADAILAFDDSDIIAAAEQGRGGNITLDTPAFFGDGFTADSLDADPDSLDGNDRVDLNATGQISSGTITRPDTSFIQNSLSALETNGINTEAIVSNSCITRDRQTGQFLITGSGGLPTRPGNAITSAYPTGEVQTVPVDRASDDRRWQMGDPIVEPQGVYRLADGRLVMSRECS